MSSPLVLRRGGACLRAQRWGLGRAAGACRHMGTDHETFEPRCAADKVETVACLGTGVIGGGWVCDFLRNGKKVKAYDPSPVAHDNLLRMVDTAWPMLEKLGLKEGACKENLLITTDLEEALDGVDCVQESVPEDEKIKKRCFHDIDMLLPPAVPVMSSISGSYSLAELQTAAPRHPSRFCVAHPFNPPYLIPLVELVGSPQTDPAVISWAFDFYKSCEKFPMRCSRENPGYVGNRLQDALWREALHMLTQGEATFEEIDAAVVYGPGLRWSVMGPLTTFFMAGGPDGYQHFFEHFGPTLTQPWTRLIAPPITDQMQELLVEGSERCMGAQNMNEMCARRDNAIVAVLQALKEHERPVSFDALQADNPTTYAKLAESGHVRAQYNLGWCGVLNQNEDSPTGI